MQLRQRHPAGPVPCEPGEHGGDQADGDIARFDGQLHLQPEGQQGGPRSRGHRREHLPPGGLTPGAHRRHGRCDQRGDHGGGRDHHQDHVWDELVVLGGGGPRHGEGRAAEGVQRQDYPGDGGQRGQPEPGPEPHPEALRGQLGQPPDQGHRGGQPGTDLDRPERRRVEAPVVTQCLRRQGDREPGGRAYPGGLVQPGQAGEPHHQHRGDDGRSNGGDPRCQERNRHCCLWCLTAADDGAQMADQTDPGGAAPRVA